MGTSPGGNRSVVIEERWQRIAAAIYDELPTTFSRTCGPVRLRQTELVKQFQQEGCRRLSSEHMLDLILLNASFGQAENGGINRC